MSILPIIADSTEELTAIFKDLHTHPEIGFQEVRTAGIVAQKLRAVSYTHLTLPTSDLV